MSVKVEITYNKILIESNTTIVIKEQIITLKVKG
jgi:hypothetical protein